MGLRQQDLQTASIHYLHQSDHDNAGIWGSSAFSTPLIFVTAIPHSGAGRLVRMLGAHGAIKALEGLHFFGDLWDPLDSRSEFSELHLTELAASLLARQNYSLWGDRPTSVERSWGRRLVHGLPVEERTPPGVFAACLRRIATDAGRIWACEQTPRNIFYARYLLELFPNAFLVYVIRDPRAVLAAHKVASRLGRSQSSQLPLLRLLRKRLNYHPIAISKVWLQATELATQIVGHSRFMILRYDELTSAPELCAKSLCKAVGLQFEPEMIEVPRWGSTADREWVEQDLVGGNRRRTWRDVLTRSEALVCEGITHRMLDRFGYSPKLLGRYGTLTALPQLLSYPLHLAGAVALDPRRVRAKLRALAQRGQRQN